MQRTRCAYFHDPASACNRREPGQRLRRPRRREPRPRRARLERACIATHPSDFCVPLVALDAVVEVEGPDGRREVAVRGLPPAARRPSRARDALAPGELIVAAAPAARRRAFRANARYLKLRERTSFAFALVSAAAALDIDGGRSARRASPSAASPPSRGGRARPKRRSRAQRRRGEPSPAPPRRRSPGRGRPATTPSRSNSPSRIVARALPPPRRERRTACPTLPGLRPFTSGTGARPHA